MTLTREWLLQAARFALFILTQVLLARRLALFDTGFCFVYVGFLLFLPIQLGRPWELLLAFVLGWTLDLFYDTGGIHAAACVLVAFLRAGQLRIIRPRDGYDSQDTVNGHRMGWTWWLLATLPLVLVHHTAVFWIEVGHIGLGFGAIARILASALFTEVTLLIAQLLLWEPAAR